MLRWLDEARGVLDAGPCGPLLDYEGINLFDAVLAEMNLMMLAVLRHKPADGSPVTRPVSAARRLAYRWRQDLAARRAAHLSAPLEAADVLMWPRNTTHTVVLHPVMKALEGQGVGCRMLACKPRILREVHDRTPNVTYTRAAWPQELRRRGAEQPRG